VALTEPHLYCGVPRVLYIVNWGLCALMVIGYHWWIMGLVCYVVHRAAKALTKHDPYWGAVILRHLRYSHFYEA
jgi:type IV secretory pathway TrbD component